MLIAMFATGATAELKVRIVMAITLPAARGAALLILDGAESVALPERAVAAKQPQHDDEEHRYKEDCEDRSRQHATDHGTADSVLSASTSTC